MNKVISVGIDVSKSKLDASLLFKDRTRIHKAFNNSHSGVVNITSFLKTHGTAKAVPCVIESTGDYHLLCTSLISKAGYTMKCINPLITKQYQRASVRGVKTDPIDAARLADIGTFETQLPAYTAGESDIVIKKLIASLAKLDKIEQKLTQHTRQLKATLAQFDTSFETSGHDDILLDIKKEKKRLLDIIQKHAPDEARDLVKNMKGVTEKTIPVLLASLRDKEFESRDALVAFVGMDIMPRRSGTWVGKEKLSKRGNAYLRKLLYQVAWGLARHNERYKKIYEKMRADGKHYTTCLMSIARKFLSFLYSYYWKKSIPVDRIS